MIDHDGYYNYLLRRSLKGLIYRKFLLYPRLSRVLCGRVIDIGCGIGDFLAYRTGTVGVDINPKLVAHCRSRGLDARVMQVDVLPFGNSEFDGAVLDNVIEHIAEPDNLLAEIHRVLRTNSALVIGVPGKKGYDADVDHKVYYDEILLIRTLKKNGFDLDELFYMPARSKFFADKLTQYCVYAVFRRR